MEIKDTTFFRISQKKNWFTFYSVEFHNKNLSLEKETVCVQLGDA